MPTSEIEHQGLLQPESFDLDDLESAEPHPQPNGHAKHPSEDWSRGRKTWKSTSPWLRPKYIVIAVIVVAALLALGVGLNKGKGFKIPRLKRPPFSSPAIEPSSGNGTVKNWEKPSGFKIIGLIFFGRPSVVAVLDCYLKKNLVTNGGWLDEVHFAVHTEKEEDIAYLDELVTTTDLYKKIDISKGGYNTIWKEAVESEHMYIKIDDDIVRFSHHYWHGM